MTSQDQAHKLATVLLHCIEYGPFEDIPRALEAGASVEGSNRLNLRPLMVAVRAGHASAAHLLIRKGADLDAPAWRTVLSPAGQVLLLKGSRALHCAVAGGRVDTVRLLIRAGANVNACDVDGNTPLISTCSATGITQQVAVEMARELLEAGAHAGPVTDNPEGIALHFAVGSGYAHMVDLLLLKAPRVINHVAPKYGTALRFAAALGSDSVVSKLLDAGAKQPTIPFRRSSAHMDLQVLQDCPLVGAIEAMGSTEGNHDEVIRILLERHVTAIGGLRPSIPYALVVLGGGMVGGGGVLVRGGWRRARLLRMVLKVEGEDRQAHWATVPPATGDPVLRLATLAGDLTAIRVLLAAGADENVVGDDRALAGAMSGLSSLVYEEIDSVTSAAIRRELRRGPAFRALSWAWLQTRRRRGAGEGPPGVKVKVYRAERDIFFVRLIGRYALKL